ncbi:MAG: hypothetical protein AB1486_13945 [Planctomycetota bacterium]
MVQVNCGAIPPELSESTGAGFGHPRNDQALSTPRVQEPGIGAEPTANDRARAGDRAEG